MPWAGYQVNLKEKYPEQYGAFLAELRKVRKLEHQAIESFTDLRQKQEYPIFVPAWYDGTDAYEQSRNNDDWLENSDQNYFFKRQFKTEYFQSIPDNGQVFYSHCTIGPGIESFARARPDTHITAGDINPKVCAKCSKYLAEKELKNVERFVDAPAEYLTSLPENEFDTVFTHGAIWENPYRAFSEYVRIVKTGGNIIGSSVGSHGTTIFFTLFGEIYRAPQHMHHDNDFTIITLTLTEPVKRSVKMDTEVLNILSNTITPEGENAQQLPKSYNDNFQTYPVPRKIVVPQLLALGYTQQELTNSLKRLSEVAKYGLLTHDSSYNAIALQDSA